MTLTPAGEVRIEFDGALVEIRRARGQFVVTRAVEAGGDLALDDDEVPAGGAVLSLDAPSRVTFGAVTVAVDPGGSPRMRRLAARRDWLRVALVLTAASSIALALLIACVMMPRGRLFDLEVRPTIVARARLAPVVEQPAPATARRRIIVEPLDPKPRIHEGIAPIVPDATPLPPGVMRPVAPRRARPVGNRPEARTRNAGRPDVGVPRVDLSGLLGRSALGDAEDAFRNLGPRSESRDVPALGGLIDGTGGGGQGFGTIGLGTIGHVSSGHYGGLTSRGDITAQTIPRRLGMLGPLIDCLTEMPCPRIERGLAEDADVLRRAVRRHSPALRACYARALVAQPALAGSFVVQLLVDRTGRVEPTAIVANTLGDGESVSGCFREVLRTVSLPARAEPLLASYPFRLRPSTSASPSE